MKVKIFFAVVIYMVRKFSFCINFYVDVFAKINLWNIFVDLKSLNLFQTLTPEGKIFYSGRNLYTGCPKSKVTISNCDSITVGMRNFIINISLEPQ